MTESISKKAPRKIAFFTQNTPRELKAEALKRLRQRYFYTKVADLEDTGLPKAKLDLLFILLPENSLYSKIKCAAYSLKIPAKEKLIYRPKGQYSQLSFKKALLFRLNEPLSFFLITILYLFIFTPCSIYQGARKFKFRPFLLGILKIYALFLSINLFKKRIKAKIERILIIRNDGIGDAVLSLASLRSVRNSYPEAKISVLASALNQEIFSQDNLADEILVFDHKSSLTNKLEAIRLLKKRKFDLALDLRHADTLTEALIIFFAGIPERIGYSVGKHGFLFTKREHLADPDNTHEVDISLNIARASGATKLQRDFFWMVGQPEKEKISGFLKETGIKDADLVIGVNPGGKNLNQRWEIEKFAALCDSIIENYDAKIIFTGSLQDQEMIKQIMDIMQKNAAVSSAGKLNLRQLFALIQRCCLFISNNTGPLHMACALNIPTVSINGPTVFNRWEPIGNQNLSLKKNMPCQPCGLPQCQDPRCMKMIDTGEVFECVKKQLKKITAKNGNL